MAFEWLKAVVMALLDHLWCFNIVLLIILLISSKNIPKELVPNKTLKDPVNKIKDNEEIILVEKLQEPQKKPHLPKKLILNSNIEALSHNIHSRPIRKTTRVTIKEGSEQSTIVRWIPNFSHLAEVVIKHYKVVKIHSKLKDNPSFNIFSYLLLHLHIAFYHYLKAFSIFHEPSGKLVETIQLYETHGFQNLRVIPNLKPWFESLGGAEDEDFTKFEISLPPRKEPLIRNSYPERIDFNSPKGRSPVQKYDSNDKANRNEDFYLHVYSQIQAVLDGYYSHTTTEIFPNFSAILLATWFVFSTNSIDKRRFISANNIKELKYLDQGNVRISFANIVGGSMEFEKVDESFAYIARDTLIDYNGKDDIHDDINAYLNITSRLLKHLKEISVMAEEAAEYDVFDTGIWNFADSLLSVPSITTDVKMIKPGIRSTVLNEMSLQEYSTLQEIVTKSKENDPDTVYDSIATGLIWDNSKGITPGYFYKDDKFYYYDRRAIDPWFTQGTLYHSQVFNKDLITSGFTLANGV